MQIICHSFPFFAEKFSLKFLNFVCLLSSIQKIIYDAELLKEIFNNVVPNNLKLVSLAERLLGFTMGREEQESVWSSRPLRITQQRYASRDSCISLRLAIVLIEKIER